MRETERPIAFKPWIYEIAKNACIDQFRRSRRAEEVSLQADDGLAPGDYGRLVGSDPEPDDAVAAKQELDNLCGAFGGLSDTHHEILVLRELEGLSYREIGDKMGMSRPAVESTLFRARRRLTEEYDELVSGARCLRIQNLIATTAGSRLGAREQRRLSRHVAYCQPCRREALAAGFDAAILTHTPLRKRAAAKVAAILPFPIFNRWRGGGGDGGATAANSGAGGLMAHAPMLSEQLSGGWGKLATVAAVLVAGVGAAGVGTKVAGHHDRTAPPKRAAAAQDAASSSSAVRKPARVNAAGAPAKGSASSTHRTQRRGAARRGARNASGSGSTLTAAGGSAPAPASGSGGTGSSGGSSKVPALKVPTSAPDPVKHVADDVVAPVVQGATGVVQGATNTVEQATQPVTNTVNQAGQVVQDTTGLPVPTLP
jgi:RNA polymerase sigma factor (sigma-70 family)